MPDYEKSQNMNWRAFFAHVVHSIMWPAVIVIFLFSFRGVITDKIRQAEQMKLAGMLEFAFPIAEKAIADEQTLNEILTDGINSPEEMRTVNRIASASSLYASLISKAGFEGEAVTMAEKNHETAQQILRDVVAIKEAGQKANLSIKDIRELKEDITMLETIGVKPGQINSDEAVDRIREASTSPEIPEYRKERLRSFINKPERDDFRKKLNSLEKARIDPKAIRFHKIEPDVLEKLDQHVIRMSIRQRPMPGPE